MSKKTVLSPELLERVAAQFKALSVPSRLVLLRSLFEGGRSVGELVVLSGCETARGWTQSGEPPVGLASTLLRAGCRAVVSSVWNVPDLATAEFMERFYRALWSGDVAPSVALRRAQIETIAHNREMFRETRPETWGGFVVLRAVP